MNLPMLPTVLPMGILGTPDSEELWADIINKLNISKDTKFLVVGAGYGTEAKILLNKLIENGYSKDEAIDAIHLIDKFTPFTNRLKAVGFKNVINHDFLTWETDMKFDVVLGNPPFQEMMKDGKRKDQASNLWSKFWYKALEMSNNVAFITPTSWLSPSRDLVGKERL